MLTAKEVSSYLRVPMSTLYGLTKSGKIRGSKVGKHWRYFETDIQGFLEGSHDKQRSLLQSPAKNSDEDRTKPAEIHFPRNGKRNHDLIVGKLVNILFVIEGNEEDCILEVKGEIVKRYAKKSSQNNHNPAISGDSSGRNGECQSNGQH